MHREYLQAGCDVVSTNTWGLASALATDGPRLWPDRDTPVHWMDVGRRGLRLARQAVHELDRDGECAVAFSLNGDVDSDEAVETIRLLARLFADEPEPPDLILLETLALLRPSLDAAIEGLLATGLPVWLSFRRCRHGLCGIYGQHWGGPEGDAFGRAARRFEEMGAAALLINCIPPDHVSGMVSYLRDFTDLPLGVYPTSATTRRGWRFTPASGRGVRRAGARWRDEGAQIVGGCCGVRPEHIAAAARGLAGTAPGHRRPIEDAQRRLNGAGAPAPVAAPEPWTDGRRRALYPLPFPDLSVEPGVAAPGAASYMAWRYVFSEGIGAHQRCLDIGCGTGILAVQLALNGAAHVRALDIDDRAVANTLANAFRNNVADRVTAETVDLFPWVPEERYEVVVASLYQKPTDRSPGVEPPAPRLLGAQPRRPADRQALRGPGARGRGLHRAALDPLPAPHGRRPGGRGFVAQVVDHTLFSFPPEQEESLAQIGRVEELSDAYHLTVGEEQVMVAYLLEVRHAP